MHWFWRGLFAVVLGCGSLATLFIGATVPPGIASNSHAVLSLQNTALGPPISTMLGLAIIGVIHSVTSLGMYGLLTRLYGPKMLTDGETRCRKCHYILKGIREPRCPECGERI